MSYELPLPCKHVASQWRYRVSSHADGEPIDTRAHCSVWVCADCVDRGKTYVAANAHCSLVVIDGVTRKVVKL